jgi:hypothetical protein
MSQKFNLLWALALLTAAPLFAQDAGTFKQESATGVAPSSNLTEATAVIADGLVKISFTVADGTPTKWHHIYLNTDGSGSTGFIHSGNSVGGKGMDFLVEPNFLYHWSGGDDQRGWHWERVQPLEATVTGKTVSYQWPSSLLNLGSDAKVSLLIETMNDNYAQTVDLLPRNQGGWTIKAGAPGVGNMVPASASPSAGPVAVPDPQARARFKKINSYACYYGPGQTDALSERDAVIVETRNLSPADVAAVKKKEGLSLRATSVRVKTTSCG